MNEKIMKRLRQTELSILDAVHNFCIDNNIKYSLFYGTLLGAVRHGEFIPWDDDIDIVMPRSDYERFLALWGENPPKGYILQNYYTDVDFTNNFSKVRKDKTTFLQNKLEENKKYHKGIFIDIFPLDFVAPNKFTRSKQYIACAVNLLYSREYTSGTGGIIGAIEKFLLKINVKNHPKWRMKTERIIKKYMNDGGSYCFSPSTIKDCKVYFPGDLFSQLTSIKFCGKEYLTVKDYIKVLEICYGDYMQLPPVEERVMKHSPKLIDFEHNYEELNT